MSARGLGLYGGLALAGIAIDQLVKALVEARLPMQEMVDLVPFLALYRTYNTGIAFSMLSWVGDRGLMLISLAVIGFVLVLAARSDPRHVLGRIGFALIISGALGNLIDRAVYGHVIDYILFHTPVWSFAVFNLADAFISVGAAAVVLQEFFGQKRPEPAVPEDN